jgi:hypothetical protein
VVAYRLGAKGRVAPTPAGPGPSARYDQDPLPSAQELAEQFGNADGQRVHVTPASMRYRWLELAQQAVLKR